MPIMTKMRDSMPVILIGLVVMFVVMIVFEWGMDYLGLKGRHMEALGKVNGVTITYQEFNDRVKRAVDQQKKQNKDIELDDNQMEQLRGQEWERMVQDILLEKEIERRGITVTDEEIRAWVVEYPETLPDNIKRIFSDSTGTLNQAYLQQAISAQTPEVKNFWLQVETMLRQQRRLEKLSSILSSTVRVSEEEILQKFQDQEIQATANYVLFDPSRFVKDEDVPITDTDLKAYYDQHQEDFKRPATRKLKYVLIRDTPSRQDTVDVLNTMNKILADARKGVDFKSLIDMHSEAKATDAFFKHGELGPVKENAIDTVSVGDIVGPLKDYDGYHLIKVLERREGKDEFVKVSHILIQGSNKDSIKALAQEVLRRARKGEDFAQLARMHSKDAGSAQQGGEVGWFGKGKTVKPFEEASFKAKTGEIVGPVETQYGFHVIKVEAKDKGEVRIGDIKMSVMISGQTRDALFKTAQDFMYLARDGSFENEAKISTLEVRETAPFTRGGVIPGIGLNPGISGFAFESSLGDISEVFKIQSGYLVCMITEVKKEGPAPFDEVKENIKVKVMHERKMEKLRTYCESLRSKIKSGDSLGVVTTLDPTLIVQSTGPFPAGGIPLGVGRDYTFIGTVFALKADEISQPVTGARGYYLIQVVNKTPFDSTAYKTQWQTLRDQLLQDRRNSFLSNWMTQLKENAAIVDNREKFFR